MAEARSGAEPAIGELRIRILGPLDVEGVDSSTLGSRKQRSLLRMLALGGGAPVSVDRLAEGLWPDELPARPSDQVGVLVSRLRSVIGPPRVIRSDAGYALVADWIDLLALEQLATEARRRLSEDQPAAAATAASAGLALVNGPLLVDEPDASWADEARTVVDRTISGLRRTAAEAALATGDPFGAIGAAQGALDQDPYDEHALRLLMNAFARAGRPGSALAAYAKTRDVLIEELGANPSQITEALHLAILRDELAPDAPAGLDHAASELQIKGRHEERHVLDRALEQARGRVQVIVVEGEPGIGKTTLIESWAGSVTAQCPVLWGTSDPVGTALPLQPVLDALDRHLSRAGEEEADTLRQRAGPVLAPLLSGFDGPFSAPDPLTAQAALFSGALQVLRAVAGEGTAVLVLDDIHLADTATLAWLGFVARRPTSASLLVIVSRRPEQNFSIEGANHLVLSPLDLEAATKIVGDRAPLIYERSGGNPLFLVELANFEGDELPASILEAVAARCAQAGPAAETLQTAALLGPEIDLDLLAAVMHESAVVLLRDLEAGQRLMILEERGASYAFRHALVREALEAGASPVRRALIHRDAARLLAARPRRDPLLVSVHARHGGDLDLAAAMLAEAAEVASARFDHAEAERLLGDSLALAARPETFLARGRVYLTTEQFAQASADAERAMEAGSLAGALELASWSAYYLRDFDRARELCRRANAAVGEGNNELKRSVAALAGRIAHADGHLDLARTNLEAASGGQPASGVAAVWLGWLMTDRGEQQGGAQLAEDLQLDPWLPVHPFAPAHRALLASYSNALLGRVDQAMSLLETVDEEVQRRQLDHFTGRTANYRAWLLRNLLCSSEADELNQTAAAIAAQRGLREIDAQSALDLADGNIRRGDLAEASVNLAHVDSIERGFAFDWKALLRRDLLVARLALADHRPEEAEAIAAQMRERASAMDVPRYVTLASVVGIRARAAQGNRLETRPTETVLNDLGRFAALEAWWLTAELARDLEVEEWWGLAAERVNSLVLEAGALGERFGRQAGKWLDKTRSSRRSA